MIPLAKTYRRVVQLELNELSREVLDALIAQRLLPAFERLDATFARLETLSDGGDANLEPWIQWTSAHTGLAAEMHRVQRLGDSCAAGVSQTWELLEDARIDSTIVCAPNATRGRARSAFFIADPWGRIADVQPRSMQRLWSFLHRRSTEHSARTPDLRDLVQALSLTRLPGVNPALAVEIATLMLRERVFDAPGWPLAEALDRLIFEIFFKRAQRARGGYFTVFLNCVAHYQHHFWRQLGPRGGESAFDPSIRCPDCGPDDDPVRHGYRSLDRMLAAVLTLARDPDTLVIIATGLTQVPFVAREHEGGEQAYRLRNHGDFLRTLGLAGVTAVAKMSTEWIVEAASREALGRAATRLLALRIEGAPLFTASRRDGAAGGSLFLRTAATRRIARDARIVDGDRTIGRFHAQFAHTAVKSGAHAGGGLLWLSDRTADGRRPVPITALHTLALDAFGVRRLNYGNTVKPGTTLPSLYGNESGR